MSVNGPNKQSTRGHHKHGKCTGHHAKDGHRGNRHCSHGHKNHHKHHHHHYRESSKNGTLSSSVEGNNEKIPNDILCIDKNCWYNFKSSMYISLPIPFNTVF